MGGGNCLIGRQAILNRNESIVAYELLFRSVASPFSMVGDATQATANVIVNSLTEFGLENLLGQHRGFINLDTDLLMDDSLNILPKGQIVIELLETIEVTPAFVEHCRSLKGLGFTLALDDHDYNPDFHELYNIVDIVKVDLIQSPVAQLGESIKQFKRYPLQLLAEKVETDEEFQSCLGLGFDLFQGYYFAKPSLMKKKRLGESTTTMLKLMRLLDEDAELAEIEEIIKKSPGLTYKLLLLVNSVGIGARSKIESVRHAITIIGRHQIKRWVQLALFAGDDSRGMENPLVEMAAVRASIMENLACRHPVLKNDRESAEKAFIVGILSILDSVYEVPMDDVLRALNLSEDIRDALVSHAGDFGRLLHVAKHLEAMDSDAVLSCLGSAGLTLDNVLQAQMNAYAWRSQIG
ncbi:MAG TPA: EAL domain-containing protein [Geobacter sp.]|nr:EAL domain-containing protein [Geobacter sp.]